MEQLSEMAQYFLMEYSPAHADVDFAFALPAGDGVAQLSYTSADGGQTIQINLTLHDDNALVSDSGSEAKVDLPATRGVTVSVGTVTHAVASASFVPASPRVSTSRASLPLTSAIELTSTVQSTTLPQPDSTFGPPLLSSPQEGGAPVQLWILAAIAGAVLAMLIIIAVLLVFRCRRRRARGTRPRRYITSFRPHHLAVGHG
ncbi:hypothetical protein C8T65DRAFT_645802 [Cerioporus squamosus]|nr:hypothetical protein C8T65DRAFT_645802 [Cerioporus squamosus]